MEGFSIHLIKSNKSETLFCYYFFIECHHHFSSILAWEIPSMNRLRWSKVVYQQTLILMGFFVFLVPSLTSFTWRGWRNSPCPYLTRTAILPCLFRSTPLSPQSPGHVPTPYLPTLPFSKTYVNLYLLNNENGHDKTYFSSRCKRSFVL